MNDNNFKVTIHMVSSLDGFIATNDGSVSWMESKDEYPDGVTLSDEDMEQFLKSVDCYVMGSGTYLHALELGWPYGNTPVIVLSSKDLKSKKESVSFYSGDLEDFVHEKLKPNFQNVWMVGGAMLTKEFIRKNLADEILITIMPVLLGDGKLFFDYIGKEQRLHLKDTKVYKDGMVELCYELIK